MIPFEVNICYDHPGWQNSLDNIESMLEKISARICYSLKLDGRDFDINILLSGDEKLQSLNKNYRDKDKPTNVLSFPFYTFTPKQDVFPVLPEKRIFGMTETLGDLAVSFETTQAEAKEQQKQVQDHFIHLCIHGILHLLGYDHIRKEDADCMENLEIDILSQFGIANPYILTETM